MLRALEVVDVPVVDLRLRTESARKRSGACAAGGKLDQRHRLCVPALIGEDNLVLHGGIRIRLLGLSLQMGDPSLSAAICPIN
jgi:hypothetical protein